MVVIQSVGPRTVLILFCCLLVPAAGIQAESTWYRETMEPASVDVIKALLAFAQDAQYEKYTEALEFIVPVFKEVLAKYRVDIERRIREVLDRKNQSELEQMTSVLVYYDMMAILDEIVVNTYGYSSAKLKVWCKIAYRDYLFISLDIIADTDAGFETDRLVKSLFRKLFSSTGSSSPYSNTHDSADRESIALKVEGIKTAILKTFPELALPVEPEESPDAEIEANDEDNQSPD